MNLTRPSYLPTCAQADTYNAVTWPHNTLKSYAPQARESYARGTHRPSYAPRIPTVVRQCAVATSDPRQAQPVVGVLAAA